jgi:DNA-directed RNA polymerase specialized sigma24 family protein
VEEPLIDHEKIRRIVLGLVGRRHVFLDDIIQDVCLFFLSHEKEEQSWTMIRWRTLDVLRSKKRHVCLELRDEDAVARTEVVCPFADIDVNVLIKRARLSEQEQLLLFYRYTLGLSVVETSERVGLASGTVTRMLTSTLEKLRGVCL